MDAKSARIQISVNIDMPLQFERRVGFPNGDTGKVTFLYVGLHRYCFTCKMISHDENSCPELTEEQRQQKRLERLALNVTGSHRQLPALDDDYEHKAYGKRPRSPTLESSRKSPPRKFQTDASHGRNRSYGYTKESSGHKAGLNENHLVGHKKHGTSIRTHENFSQRNKSSPHGRSPPR